VLAAVDAVGNSLSPGTRSAFSPLGSRPRFFASQQFSFFGFITRSLQWQFQVTNLLLGSCQSPEAERVFLFSGYERFLLRALSLTGTRGTTIR
jgi:hypothetical protein